MRGNNPNITSSTSFAFLLLGLIRGSFALVLSLAVSAFKSPSLTFLLRTPLTVILYLISVLSLWCKNDEQTKTITRQFKSREVYWRTAVMGLIQLALPYMCYMYALIYIPVTLAGCFMAITPWITVILDKVPYIKPNMPSHLGKHKILAMVIGLVGMLCVSVSDLYYLHDKYCNNVAGLVNKTSYNNMTSVHEDKTCQENKSHIITSFVALLCGTLSWSISSAFWRLSHGDVNFLVSGTLNNLFGSGFALILWLALRRFEESDEVEWLSVGGLVSISFLSVASGWLAAVILFYLYQNLGPNLTNRAVCMIPLVALIEDHALVRMSIEGLKTWYFGVELLGVLLTVIGLSLFSIEVKRVPLTLLEESLISGSQSSYEIDIEAEARRYRMPFPDSSESEESHGYVSFPGPAICNNNDAG